MGALVGRVAGESYFLSAALLLPLTAFQSKLAVGTYRGARSMRTHDCRSAGSRGAPGSVDLCDRAPRARGYLADFLAATRKRCRGSPAAGALRSALSASLPIGNSRVPR